MQMRYLPPIPIIMLNWNGLDDTRECLAALDQQSREDFLIHLVDNGSEASEVAAIREEFGAHPRIRLHFNSENLGFTLANNRILRQILAEDPCPPYVVLLNNDTQPAPEWLSMLLARAEEDGVDMVSSKMINYFDRRYMDNAGHQILNTLEVLPLGHGETVENYRTGMKNVGPCAGAGLYTTAMLRSIGTFDEHFRNGYEDVELGLRATVCGYRSVYAPDAIVYHKVSRSVNKIRDFAYTLGIQQHVYYIVAKLIPGWVLLVCFPFFLFRTLAALLLNLLFLRWKFLRIQIFAMQWVFAGGRKELLRVRREFFSSHQTIGTISLLRKMDFFLKKDLQRFYKYLIRREKMVFEKYD